MKNEKRDTDDLQDISAAISRQLTAADDADWVHQLTLKGCPIGWIASVERTDRGQREPPRRVRAFFGATIAEALGMFLGRVPAEDYGHGWFPKYPVLSPEEVEAVREARARRQSDGGRSVNATR